MKLSQGKLDVKPLITHATTDTTCLNTSQQKAVNEFYMRKLPEYNASKKLFLPALINNQSNTTIAWYCYVKRYRYDL